MKEFRCLKLALLFFLFVMNGLIAQSIDINIDSLFLKFMYLEENESDKSKDMIDVFDSFVASLSDKYDSDKPQKSLKKLFRSVHDKFFIKYKENPVFLDIFSTGSYNCVTASALYSFIFEELEIPYEIREVPTHVYVVAYPGEHNITVESTMPDEGIIKLREKEIENYKKELVANKILTEEEVSDPGFIKEYIYQDSTINIVNLYGIQLYNRSLKLLESGDYRESIALLSSSKKYHDRDYINELILVNIGLMIEGGVNLTTQDKCYVLKEYYKTVNPKSEDPASSAMGMYYILIEDKITSEQAANNLLEISDCISEDPQISNEFKEDVKNSVGIANALYYYNALDISKSIYHLERTFQKDNKNSYRLIAEVLNKHFQQISSPTDGLDTLGKYEQIFPFVKDDPILQGFGVWCYMNLIYFKFELNEEVDGIRFLNEFEKRYGASDNIRYDSQLIGAGYGAASAYYIRQKNESKAESLLIKGLEYSKESLELNRKLKLLRSDTW